MAAEKKIPMRQCLGCRTMKPKAALIRIVHTPEGEILLDRKGKANGRGAYVCQNRNCLETALKRRAPERALDCQIPDQVKELLLQELSLQENTSRIGSSPEGSSRNTASQKEGSL